ncbi:MAG TPA: SLBB domain-containing protein [Candidatus Angelobacter sp.]
MLRTVVVLILSFFLVMGAAAQTEQPMAVPQRPAGVQITNNPEDQDQRIPLRDREGDEAQAPRRNQNAPSVRESIPLPPEPDTEFQEFVTSTLGRRLPIFGQNLFRNVPSTFAPLDRVPVTPDYLIGPGDELVVHSWGQIDINYRAVVDRTGTIYLPRVGAISVAGLRYDQLNDAIKSAIGRVYKNFELSVTLGQLRSIQVFVVGQVRRPGVYTVSSLSTLVNALFASGGPSSHGSMRNIQLKRQGKEVTSFDLYDLIVRGDKSKDAQLLPGDVIYVAPVGRLAALSGSVNVPAIFELKDHDTLGDAISYAGGLTTTAAGQRAMVERIDDHHARRTEEFSLAADGLGKELHDGDIVRFLHISPRFENTVTLRGNVSVPGRYPWHDGMRVRDLIPRRDVLVTYEYWKRQNRLALDPESESFQLKEDRQRRGRTQSYSDQRPSPSSNDRPDQQDRQDQSPSSNNDQDREQRTGERDQSRERPTDRIEAQRATEEEIKNEVKRSAAEINWEYALVQRLNPDDLTTRLLPFNLGKAIAGDDAQNLPLQPGDVITIFSQADMQVPIGQQSKFVRLEGEFKTAGVYQVEPGETLQHLLVRVGGFTPEAYLYGAEFTRESTREEQQRRLDQYIDDLSKAIERNAGAQRNLSPEEALAERQSLEGQRRLLDRMRALKANGRIVMELKPGTATLASFPDLVLEDGDRLLVPFRPATVNVLGSVYNSNAFIYKPGKTVGDYLRLSGGSTRDGDKGRSFVIRADGSTLSSQSFHGLFSGGLNTVPLMPGDTVVVPEKLDKGAVLRGFKDWTQIVGQFVLGAAAVKVLLQ